MKRQKCNPARSCSPGNAAACEFGKVAPDDLAATTGGLHGEREEHETPLQERDGRARCNGETLESPLDDDSGNVAVFALADYVDAMRKVVCYENYESATRSVLVLVWVVLVCLPGKEGSLPLGLCWSSSVWERWLCHSVCAARSELVLACLRA